MENKMLIEIKIPSTLYSVDGSTRIEYSKVKYEIDYEPPEHYRIVATYPDGSSATMIVDSIKDVMTFIGKCEYPLQ